MYCWIAQLNIVCGSPRLKPNIIPLHILSTSRAKYGKLQGWKLLPISRFCGYSQKFSLQNWGLGVFWWYQQAICEFFFPRRSYFPPIRESFLLRKFPTYTVYRWASTKGEAHTHLDYLMCLWSTYEPHPQQKLWNVVEICDRIVINFHLRLPQMYFLALC